jgi:hypothetical protein
MGMAALPTGRYQHQLGGQYDRNQGHETIGNSSNDGGSPAPSNGSVLMELHYWRRGRVTIADGDT